MITFCLIVVKDSKESNERAKVGNNGENSDKKYKEITNSKKKL